MRGVACPTLTSPRGGAQKAGERRGRGGARSCFLLLFLLLSACRPAAPAQVTPSPAAAPTRAAARLAPTQPYSTPRPTPTFLPAQPPATFSQSGASLPGTDPLRFAFPTPGQAAVSALRPALYPPPWAPTPYDHFYFSRPIAADEVNWPVADYRYGGVFFEDIVHTGVDIPAPKGTPVLAAGSGKVVWAGYGLFYGSENRDDPYGLAVLIRHNFGYKHQPLYTVYGHMDSLAVVQGQPVETGDLLGLSGQTGKVTGPHLHFEVRLGEGDSFSTRNPELWLVPPQGWGVLVGKVMNKGGGLLKGQLVTVKSMQDGQAWRAYTYGGIQVTSDDYYQENLVISDLPSGRYEIQFNYLGRSYGMQIEIQPGLVSYFTFQGWNGFGVKLPPAPGADFTPP